MTDRNEEFSRLLKDLEVERENTVTFLVESIYVTWSSSSNWPMDGAGFTVTLSGAVLQEGAPTIATHPKGTVTLHTLGADDYALNEQGKVIVGALMPAAEEMEAHLFFPADDLRTLATLLPTAVRDRTPVQIRVRVFAGLKEWSGRDALRVARTWIRIGEIVLENL